MATITDGVSKEPPAAQGTEAADISLIKLLPIELIFEVFSYLSLADLSSCRLVDREWAAIASDPSVTRTAVFHDFALNSNKWKRCLGEGVVRGEDNKREWDSLPRDIYARLMRPSPAFPGRRIIETHMLAWIPHAITLNFIRTALNQANPEVDISYSHGQPNLAAQYGRVGIETSGWVLMSRENIPDCRRMEYTEQELAVARIAGESLCAYEVPSALEATVCIMLNFLCTGTRLFADSFTHCKETTLGRRVIVGGFATKHLYIYSNNGTGSKMGVALLLRL